ncbi:hypothetical protein ACFE04_017520 [Oxalis oulophora]
MKGGELELPPGFRFHPTDDELVNHYLIRKCTSQPLSVPINLIAEIDLYKFDPWQLPDMAMYGEKEWYFFSPRDRKYPNGSRPNRAAGTGYWKATGADKPIGTPKPLGIKKALVFYAGKAPKGVKTNWIMHEYRLANVDRSATAANKKNNNNSRLDDWVLCRIYNKKGTLEKHFPLDPTSMKLEKMDHEEQKPHISYAQNLMLQQQLITYKDNDLLHTDTSDSMPMLHTDSSGSDHVLSPEFTCEKEVQSDLRWNEFDNAFFNGIQQFNYMDGFDQDGPFAYQDHYQNQDDIFMFLQKPF